jgi:hypothetical protein
MLERQNLLLFSQRDVRVYFRGLDGGVSEHPLDVPDVHILFEQQGRKGVSEHMRRDMLSNPGLSRMIANRIPDGLLRKAPMQTVDKKISGGFNFRIEHPLVFR